MYNNLFFPARLKIGWTSAVNIQTLKRHHSPGHIEHGEVGGGECLTNYKYFSLLVNLF